MAGERFNTLYNSNHKSALQADATRNGQAIRTYNPLITNKHQEIGSFKANNQFQTVNGSQYEMNN